MKSNLESDARKSQNINASWKAVSATSDKFSAVLFYDESLSQGSYALYETHNRRSVGYFFRDGGSLADTDMIEGIQGFSYGKGFAVLSMNKVNAVRVERVFEKEDLPKESREVDPGKPLRSHSHPMIIHTTERLLCTMPKGAAFRLIPSVSRNATDCKLLRMIQHSCIILFCPFIDLYIYVIKVIVDIHRFLRYTNDKHKQKE